MRDYVLAEANAQIDEDLTRRRGPFVTTIFLPAGLPEVPCDLHVDVPEAEVHYARRGERPWPSRLCHRPPRLVHAVTVVAGFNPDDPEAGIVLYTMYGGEPAPKEPGDPSLREHERAAALGFWRQAALSVPRVATSTKPIDIMPIMERIATQMMERVAAEADIVPRGRDVELVDVAVACLSVAVAEQMAILWSFVLRNGGVVDPGGLVCDLLDRLDAKARGEEPSR